MKPFYGFNNRKEAEKQFDLSKGVKTTKKITKVDGEECSITYIETDNYKIAF